MRAVEAYILSPSPIKEIGEHVQSKDCVKGIIANLARDDAWTELLT